MFSQPVTQRLGFGDPPAAVAVWSPTVDNRRVMLIRRMLLVALLATLAVGLLGCGRTQPQPVVVSAATPAAPSSTVAPRPTAPVAPAAPAVARAPDAPQQGRWINVDVTRFTVRLMDGTRTMQEVGPVGVGREIDTGRYESTQTGLFYVYEKRAGLTFDAPYNTYIDWWVGFDPAKDNGFHSFLLDKAGVVVDASTGRISNGCIRTGNPKLIFEFAEVGMPVWVHA